MNENEAQAALVRYEETNAARDVLRAAYDEAVQAAYATIAPALDALHAQEAELEASITPTLDSINAQYDDRLNGMDIALSAAEANVRITVLAVAKSVKGAHLQAVYSKGRTSWDSKGLDGYAVAYPEVLKFRSVGEPNVSIRTAK